MLPKNRRITTRVFSRLFRRCKKFRGKTLEILYYGEQSPSRFAVVVRKRDYKFATDRNILRRKIYHLIEDAMLPEVLSGGVFIVLFTGKRGFNEYLVQKDLEAFLLFHASV